MNKTTGNPYKGERDKKWFQRNWKKQLVDYIMPSAHSGFTRFGRICYSTVSILGSDLSLLAYFSYQD